MLGPLGDIDTAVALTREAIDSGAAALMIPSICPRHHGPTHIGLDPVWAQAQEAGVPIVFHVGGGRPMDETYKQNGLPPVPDFHGGDANFTSVSYMAIPEAPMQTLATMIFDGVLDRFESLKIGVIEQGAAWVPGWMRSMDSAASAFIKNEERLQRLSLKPSEFVARQVRVTPYPHEDVGWIIANTGPGICMFSSDYPHVEGGRQPLRRFEQSLADTDAMAVDAFYAANFADLLGLSV
ncbi:MAG: amidohydrolase family protein [Ilumatobacteraceae bacterium]